MFTCTIITDSSDITTIEQSTGTPPPFFNSFISNTSFNNIFDQQIKQVQDYHILIYKNKSKYNIIISKDINDLKYKDVIDKKKKDKIQKTKNKEKKRQWIGDEKELNFSDINIKEKKERKHKEKVIEEKIHSKIIRNIKNVFLKNIFVIFIMQIFSFLKKIRFNRKYNITINALETKLIEKNLSLDIVSKLLYDYYNKPINNNTNTLNSTSTSIIDKVIPYNIKKNNLQEYLTYNISKIIKRYESDILVDNILNSTKPYVISFIGINGVGKTTTLGKIITFLKSKIENLDIIVGGCDTFRSGAIEQLQLICDNKNVELYHRGYNKDDSKIVAETINYAKKKNIKNTDENNIEKDKRNTVVLIDTAGRMHTKHHLMQSLGKIYENNIIDHTIFVSEALIGNEGINVVKEFSKVVKIDSLVITKIDTVGNKIGHIVNLTATVDVPVLFIGTGQSSNDIEEINVEWIVDRLIE